LRHLTRRKFANNNIIIIIMYSNVHKCANFTISPTGQTIRQQTAAAAILNRTSRGSRCYIKKLFKPPPPQVKVRSVVVTAAAVAVVVIGAFLIDREM